MPGFGVHLLIAVAVGLAVCQLGNLVTTVYLHRALAHRALRPVPWLNGVFRVVTWITTGIRPRQWVAVHRKHHAFTDVAGDPHSPVLQGYLTVQLTNPYLYRKVAKDDAVVARYAKDLPPDRWDRILFDHALVGLGIGVALLWLALGWQFALIAGAVHAVTYLLMGGAINGFGHTWGRRPYPGNATNNQWLAWLVAGEGLHNNHHAAPTSARLSLHKGEVDPAWWFIRLARRFGWVTIRHDQPHLVSGERDKERAAA
jgi:stearoyl-CoA desaturase (delta-9 desaturase)